MIQRTRRRSAALVAASCLFVCGLPGSAALAQTPAPARASAAEASLLAAEDATFAAKIARDLPTIDRGMADDATYTHGSGRVQSKTEYLKSLAEGQMSYRSIEPIGRVVQVSGNLGITHATLRMVVGERQMRSSYLAVYVKRQGRWQLLFWQTSPESGETAPTLPAKPTPTTQPHRNNLN